MPLEVQPTMQEPTDAIRSLENGKAVGLDGVSVELFSITLNDDPTLRRRLLDIVVRICMYVCMYVWSSHIAEYGSTR